MSGEQTMNGGRLEVEGLNAFYGQAHILFDVALTVGAGEVVALMGRNGAGKSTTLNAILSLVENRRGSVHFDGADISRLPTHRIVRAGLGYVPEDRRIFTDLSVSENLDVGLQPSRGGAPTWTREMLFELFPNLAELQDRRAGYISGGEQQMLTIARTLMGNPSLIMLDEPSEGLAPKIVEQMAAAIGTMKAEGLRVLISEQNLHFAALIADRAYVIEKGRIRYDGPMAELMTNTEVRDAYLAV